MNDTYIIVRNFISSDRSKELSFKFENYCKRENVEGDPQVPGAPAVYNYLLFLELLCEKTPEISSAIGEPVVPCYTYARVYSHGQDLPAHTDRESCDISLTVNLDCDTPWPIWIRNKDNEDIECVLNPGDAVIYKGMEALHWRNKFDGERCVQVFLHYIRSRGPIIDNYFDKQRLLNQAKAGLYYMQMIDTDV